jgi:hypothetical protein
MSLKPWFVDWISMTDNLLVNPFLLREDSNFIQGVKCEKLNTIVDNIKALVSELN